jgi:hypothetical protein
LQLAKRDKLPHAKSKKTTKIKESNSFLQLAKGSLIAFKAIAKGNQIPFRVNCIRNLRIAFNADNVGNIPLGELN